MTSLDTSAKILPAIAGRDWFSYSMGVRLWSSAVGRNPLAESGLSQGHSPFTMASVLIALRVSISPIANRGLPVW